MFDSQGSLALATAPPADWEPIPDEVWAEVAAAALEVGELPIGSELSVDWLDGLVACETVEGLTARQLSDQLTGLGEMIARAEAQRLRVIAALAPHCQPELTDGSTVNFTAHEVSVAMHMSVGAADRLIALSRELTGRLTATLDALHGGRISLRHAQLLRDATGRLADDIAVAVETKALAKADGKDPTAFARVVRRAVATCDPDWQANAEQARQECTVTHQVFPDGTGELNVRGPVEVTTVIHQALQAHAHATKTELSGTMDSRMVDALRGWAESYLASPGAPTRHGRPYTVNVTIDLPTLLGLTEHPAEIPGVGPIPSAAARQLVADGAPLRRLVTDPMTGHLLDYGRRTYTAPRPLADHLIALSVVSTGPHSSVLAANCDIDHNIPFDQGGPTNPANNTPLDRRWHRGKTLGDWTYVKGPDGSITWTSPTGRKITVDPYDYRLGP